MEPSFWEARWRKNQIGFHLSEANPLLKEYLPALRLELGDSVFMPMCGKSLDILYLRDQGFRVVGAELSELAVRAFFSENELTFTESQNGRFLRFESDGIIIFCGDIFHLRKDHLAGTSASFDRAALFAFPPEMRRRYVEHFNNIYPPLFKTLLVTVEYPQHEMSGPPFSLEETEVRELFSNWKDVELLHTADVLSKNVHLRERGITALQEKVYLLRKGDSLP